MEFGNQQVYLQRHCTQFVCADHFLPEDIVSAYSIPPDVAIVRVNIFTLK